MTATSADVWQAAGFLMAVCVGLSAAKDPRPSVTRGMEVGAGLVAAFVILLRVIGTAP